MRMITTGIALVILSVIAGLSGCSLDQTSRQPDADAVAVLAPASGSQVEGVVRFSRTREGLRVMARVIHLTPGSHGFHIHQFGDCRAADAGSAGAHFNPQGKPHGAPDAENRHAGDLANLVADQSGLAVIDLVAPMISLDGPESIIGRSVVVHAEPDDYKSQPAGASGARLACGVVGIARE